MSFYQRPTKGPIKKGFMTAENSTPTEPTIVLLDPSTFPDQPKGSGGKLPATLDNFVHLVKGHGITIRFNMMKKSAEVIVPALDVSPQNREDVTATHLESLMIRYGMSPAGVSRYILAVADRHSYDPFADWIDSKAWDGTGRLPDICSTITPAADYPQGFANVLILKWLTSVVAATYHGPGFHCRGVLTLQGKQGLGKTSWFGSLVPPLVLRDQAVKLGHGWDCGSKDSRISAINHRIVELGELEGSLRKELASLKSFVTDRSDKIRAPYARRPSEYPRMTVFGASVNDDSFLNDPTGNSRFWTISVEAIDFAHGIDMQQVFAELKTRYLAGAQWWLTADEERKLGEINARHEIVCVVGEKIASQIDVNRIGAPELPRLRAIEVLERIGIEHPTNRQLKEANVSLRAILGESRRIRGANYWSVPWAKPGAQSLTAEVY